MHSKPCSPARACGQALQFSAENILQHRLVQRQISDQLLQLAVLVLKLLQPPHLVWQQSLVLPFPIEIRCLGNPGPTTDLRNRVPIPSFKMKAFWASVNFHAFIVFYSS